MNTTAATRGLFIALEGIDGSGTTTQASLLVERLSTAAGAAHLTREPSDGPVGRALRDVLRGSWEMPPAGTALLFAADRLHHISHEIEPRLAEGRHVISDRYLLSSLAYQGLECDPAWVEEINRRATLPDLTAFVRLDPKRAATRRATRGDAEEIFENEQFQQRVAQRYEDLLAPAARSATWEFRAGSWRRERGPASDETRIGEVAIVEGDAPVEQVHEALYALVCALVASREEEKA